MLRSAVSTRASAGGAPGAGTAPGSQPSSASRKLPRCHRDWMMTFRKQLFWPVSLVSPLHDGENGMSDAIPCFHLACTPGDSTTIMHPQCIRG